MDITKLLNLANTGDERAKGQLIQVAYDELKKIAVGRTRKQYMDHSLGATALVNEVAVKLLTESQTPVDNSPQFFAYVSTAMRNLLIDHARKKATKKRGGDQHKLVFNDAIDDCEKHSSEVLDLNEALDELGKIRPRHAQVVEMRYFGGMSNQEIAEALNTSLATVKRDWVQAKSWLQCELAGDLT